ncbi:nuclear transport factor 2 family protein [Deinococcus sp. YIM 77859]|uniref:nuclear transport factor 2 family protein n=1 Tax=Deinococcus sp. YIM 77859 TaxID=1540221 RepID=UPI000552DBD2|nr:nuclear transport factor 2 family protein [Deinococcus sp. YIM 77859]
MAVSDLDAVLALDDAWNAAYHRRDPGALAELMAEDWLGFFPAGEVIFRAGLLEGMGRLPPQALMFERHAARVYGQTAITRGTLYANGTRVQSFLRVYAQQEGKWRVVCVQVVP